MMKRPPPWLVQLATWSSALIVLGAVFAAYARPDFVLMLATQIWACF
jgi:hypothetical protein